MSDVTISGSHLTVCGNCNADLNLDTSDYGPGGWLGIHPDSHPYDQNSTCCPGTQDEHEPMMETCGFCDGKGMAWGTCEECDGEIDTEYDGEDYACNPCQDAGEAESECEECDGTGETMVQR